LVTTGGRNENQTDRGCVKYIDALFYWGPRVARKPLLLAASYFFYACWNPRFVPLLATLTVIDYCAGIWMGRVRQERRGWRWQ
jgi:alginate O-acetyltransferase complex protein AlgI